MHLSANMITFWLWMWILVVPRIILWWCWKVLLFRRSLTPWSTAEICTAWASESSLKGFAFEWIACEYPTNCLDYLDYELFFDYISWLSRLSWLSWHILIDILSACKTLLDWIVGAAEVIPMTRGTGLSYAVLVNANSPKESLAVTCSAGLWVRTSQS